MVLEHKGSTLPTPKPIIEHNSEPVQWIILQFKILLTEIQTMQHSFKVLMYHSSHVTLNIKKTMTWIFTVSYLIFDVLSSLHNDETQNLEW